MLLIGYVLSGDDLTDSERLFIAEALSKTAGKRYRVLHQLAEPVVITDKVDDLMRTGFPKQEAAVSELGRQTGLSRRKIFRALKIGRAMRAAAARGAESV